MIAAFLSILGYALQPFGEVQAIKLERGAGCIHFLTTYVLAGNQEVKRALLGREEKLLTGKLLAYIKL